MSPVKKRKIKHEESSAGEALVVSAGAEGVTLSALSSIDTEDGSLDGREKGQNRGNKRSTFKPGGHDRPTSSPRSCVGGSDADVPGKRHGDRCGFKGGDCVPVQVDLAMPAITLSQTYPDIGAHLAKAEGEHQEPEAAAAGSHPYEESLGLRYRAREVGLEDFLHEATVQRQVPLGAVCTAFGVSRPTTSLSESKFFNSAAFLTKLKKAITDDMEHRIKLSRYNSVRDAVSLVRHAGNIMVITGAGVSTSLGIPDFRSQGGLYPKLREMGFEDPESVFSRDAFEQDPDAFFSVASMILPPADGKFTQGHAFLRLLQDKGKLLTLYTQNIDGIDLTAGVKRERLVQLHGSFETATCTSCGYQVKGEEVFPEIRNGQTPACVKCAEELQLRIDQMTAMRAQNGRPVRQNVQRGGTEPGPDRRGILRPDIVFMDEPPRPYRTRFERDCTRVDLVIVMGTSLPVEPVRTMPNHVPPDVPQIYIGRNQMDIKRDQRIDFDIQLLGECDVVAELLTKACGWSMQPGLRHEDTAIEIKSARGMRHCHHISREKTATKREGLKNELKS